MIGFYRLSTPGNEIRAAIEDIVDGYGSTQGYRAVWHTLQLKGLRVPR
jgi:hypothetical protein